MHGKRRKKRKIEWKREEEESNLNWKDVGFVLKTYAVGYVGKKISNFARNAKEFCSHSITESNEDECSASP